MGFREYLRRSNHRSRFAWTAVLAVLIHGIALAGSSLLMSSQAEYGMTGAIASTGGKPQATPPPEQTVDLEDFSDDVPSETRRRPRPVPTPAQPQGTGGRVSGGALAVPSYLDNPPPPYPDEARRLKQEGVVVLRAEVDSEGKVRAVELAKSSGFPLLDDAAKQTVLGWKFKPARMAGIAVSTSVKIPVLFRLQDAE